MRPRNSVNICKVTYASVRPHRHTCGKYRNTVANVDASDSSCRCTSMIIARDLRLGAGRLYRMAVTRPRVTCRCYIIPLFRRRPSGLHKPYKRKDRKGKGRKHYAFLPRTYSYEMRSPATDWYHSGRPFGGSAHEENPPPLD